MERKNLGTIYVPEKVDVTDPCYDRNVWCRFNDVPVRSGNYECVAWHSDKGDWGDRIAMSGIFLAGSEIPDNPPQRSEFVYIGNIGVDAGLAGFFPSPKPDYSRDEWVTLCESIRGGDEWITEDGFFSSSGYGDGGYDLYCRKASDGVYDALVLVFIESEDDA